MVKGEDQTKALLKPSDELQLGPFTIRASGATAAATTPSFATSAPEPEQLAPIEAPASGDLTPVSNEAEVLAPIEESSDDPLAPLDGTGLSTAPQGMSLEGTLVAAGYSPVALRVR